MGACTPSLSRNCMPPRTTRKSHRRTVSDRTMVGTAQPLCLWRPKPKGIVTTSPWTWEQQNSKRLIATRGWMTRSLPVGGEVFFLTSPFIERDFGAEESVLVPPPVRRTNQENVRYAMQETQKPFQRIAVIALGCALMLVGIIGLFLPVVP